MSKFFKAVLFILCGASVGALGFSLFAGSLFWLSNPGGLTNDLIPVFMLLTFTLPCGGFIGGVVGFAWFFEKRF